MMNTPPNIVFILIDDMGWRDLNCYGSSFYETPNIDQLAQEGLLFTDAYASCPVCSPTRASIMTGKYPATVGVTNYIAGQEEGKLLSAPYFHYLPLSEKTLATSLKEGGYHTYHVGKWHLGDAPYWPEHQGFEVNIGGCDWGNPHGGYFSPYHHPNLPDGPEGEFLDDRLTNEAIELIKKNNGKPFFLNLWYYSVHTPIQAPEENVSKFEEKAKRLGLDKVNPFELGEHFPTVAKRDARLQRRKFQSNPKYAGMIERLDQNIGRILGTLDELGLRENTIVVFYSDNGGLATAENSPTCNAPLAEGKGWMYEGGTREPLIIRWPAKIASGQRCSVPVTSTDFYPTFLQVAGLPFNPAQHCDGVSIMPLFGNPESNLPREAIFWHYPHYGNQGGTPGSSIRKGDHKLIEFFQDGHLELYNLREDIEEKHDLCQKMPQLVQELHHRLKEWRASVGAKIPQPNPDYPHCFSETQFHQSGILLQDESEPNLLLLHTQLTPKNPAVVEIPLPELMEEYLDNTVELRVNNGVRVGRLFTDENEILFIEDRLTEEILPVINMLAPLISSEIAIVGMQQLDMEFRPLQPEKFLIKIMKNEKGQEDEKS